MGKQGLAFVDGAVGRRGGAVLAGPGVEALEQDMVNLEEIPVRETLDSPEIGDCLWQVGTKQLVLSHFHDIEVFFALKVAQVTGRLEVLKGIEHGAFLPAGD